MSRSIVSSSTSFLTEAQIVALKGALKSFSPVVATRGERYATNGMVRDFTLEAGGIEATVRGTYLYDVYWEWLGNGWTPTCSCPVAPYCKHAYAVARRVLGNDELSSGSDERAIVESLASARMLSMTRSQAPERRYRGAELPAKAPFRARVPTLDLLRAAASQWEWQRAMLDLLRGAPFPEIVTMPSLQAPLREPDADLFCWRLAREINRLADGWLPSELEAYRHRPDLEARHTERSRSALARELTQWVHARHSTPPRRLRLVFGLQQQLDYRGLAAGVKVTLEARLTTNRLTDIPRTATQLRALKSEVRRNPGCLPSQEAMLLEWLIDPTAYGWDINATVDSPTMPLAGTTLLSLLGRLSEPSLAPLASWSRDVPRDLASRGGVEPDGPVRLTSEPARLLPMCVTRDGAAWVDFLFLWPDGTQHRPGDVLHLDLAGQHEWPRKHPSLVLADGAFSVVTEEPPPSLLARCRQAGGLPLSPGERVGFIGMLASQFPHLRDTLESHTRLYAVTPLVALDLRDDDWLQIRVFARGGAGEWRPGRGIPENTVVFEYASKGWLSVSEASLALGGEPYHAVAGGDQLLEGRESKETGARTDDDAAGARPIFPHPGLDGSGRADGPSTDADVWMERPAPETVAPVEAWVASTQAAPGTKTCPGGHGPKCEDRHVGWWMQATRRRMDELAEAWERRPPGVLYFGTQRVRRLLEGTAHVSPRVRIASSGLDWFSVSADWEAEGRRLSEVDLARMRTANTRFVRLESGWVRKDIADLHDETAEALADLGIEVEGGEQRLTIWQLAGARPESLHTLERLGADTEALRAVEEIRTRVAKFKGLPRVTAPDGLTAELRPYQQRGLDFLAYTSSLGIGAVLADDMGLGKTVQALAWLEHLRTQDPGGGPSLVVCPASVVHNWVREAARFVPEMRVLAFTRGADRHALRGDVPGQDLIVTNYALLRRDIDEWRKVELRAAILDEAQNIKNPDAVVTRAALELNASHRIALTGTPLENRALDLWSIVNFVNPGYLGNRARFGTRFDRPDTPAHRRSLLAAKMRPLLLRRMKNEVAKDLPPRIEERRYCELNSGQRQLYLGELRRSRRLIDKLSNEPGGVHGNKIAILAALTRLRQICCHPALVGGKAGIGSAKFTALAELLEPILAAGHKVLLFSQFVRCLELLRQDLRRRNVVCHMLTGATARREKVVTAFADDFHPCVFLISLRAGGTGLNLTSASYVVLFDPWWNPAVETQAVDRTHRIGQDRPVIAYRMLAQGTIEEKIWELQQRKAALARDILGENGFARSLTRADLAYLLTDA